MGLFDNDCYGIIGVGYFGSSVARTLASSGKSVIAIDTDASKLKELSHIVSGVYQVSSLSREALEEAGIASCKVVVIGIGENLEASILATLHCLEIGVPRVVSKAGSREHGKILEKLGADVIFPEEDAGTRLAYSLMSKANLEGFAISEDFGVISVDVSPHFFGKTVLELAWRQKFNINIVAIMKCGKVSGIVLPDTLIEDGDRVVVSGAKKDLEKFSNVNSRGMDWDCT